MCVMTKQHHLMKEIALAMKAKDFARAVQLYEDDEKGDTYEVHVYAGKSYFELKQHAKSRECYVKAARIDSEREQAHKGIVEVGFVNSRAGFQCNNTHHPMLCCALGGGCLLYTSDAADE